jgi:hypothetical protein
LIIWLWLVVEGVAQAAAVGVALVALEPVQDYL